MASYTAPQWPWHRVPEFHNGPVCGSTGTGEGPVHRHHPSKCRTSTIWHGGKANLGHPQQTHATIVSGSTQGQACTAACPATRLKPWFKVRCQAQPIYQFPLMQHTGDCFFGISAFSTTHTHGVVGACQGIGDPAQGLGPRVPWHGPCWSCASTNRQSGKQCPGLFWATRRCDTKYVVASTLWCKPEIKLGFMA